MTPTARAAYARRIRRLALAITILSALALLGYCLSAVTHAAPAAEHRLDLVLCPETRACLTELNVWPGAGGSVETVWVWEHRLAGVGDGPWVIVPNLGNFQTAAWAVSLWSDQTPFDVYVMWSVLRTFAPLVVTP